MNSSLVCRSRLGLVLFLLVSGCARPSADSADASAAPLDSSAFDDSNPFSRPSALLYEAPPFDRIRNEHYQPAIEEGMRRQRKEWDAIARQAAAPTFENTLVALERSGSLLSRSSKVFSAVVRANANDTLQEVQTEIAPQLAAHFDALYLDPRLYRRVQQIYDRRASLGLSQEQRELVELYRRDFVRAGARLPAEQKNRLRQLNQEEARLSTEFRTRLLAATTASALVLDDRAQLDGLSDGDVAAAAQAAKERDLEGKYVLPLQNTTQHPAQSSLTNRTVRRRLFEASTRRADRGDSNDTRALIQRLARLRTERASLLGYPSYAAFILEIRMAKSPEAALRLLTQLVPPAIGATRAEAAKLQAMIDREKGGFRLAAWDWQYYAERVRQAEYKLDEDQLKPYFELNRVLQDGVFYAANRLFGVSFKQRKDIPAYHPDVHVFEVFDADGKSMALFYTDFFKRDNKSGGAWMGHFVHPSGLQGTRPVLYNVSNFTKPAPGMPALLSFDDVTTLFHEFGHALHGLFAEVQYASLLETPRDFVEFPSQLNEYWALEPPVLANYARHYQTGEPMPAELIARIRKAGTFNQGFNTTEYLAAALLDLAWHTLPPGTPEKDPVDFEQQALARYGLDLPEVPPRYRTPYFAHIWSSAYSASYYAYLWSEVLDHDAYTWFKEHGGMTRANGQRYRDLILARRTTDAAGQYRAFRGRDPRIEALLLQRGFEATPAEQSERSER